MPPGPISRRQLFAGGLLGAGGLLAACSSPGAKATPSSTTQPKLFTESFDGVPLKKARWVIEENAKEGTLDWIIGGFPPTHGLEGYASTTSAPTGGSVDLMVSTADSSYHVEAYRMGYYGGYGGRLVAKSPTLQGVVQPPPTIDPSLGTVSCHWPSSWHVDLKAYPPGFYLFKLVSAKGWDQWIPFCVRDDSSAATFVIMSAVTTYQAYNMWGGFSLYKDEEGSRAKRAVMVSFDRPYDQTYEQGAADFVTNELPLVFDMERLGLDTTYWTDIDLHLHGGDLTKHGALMSLGHDEYWSREMRDNADSALSAGVNLAFLGANAIYRKIRLSPSLTGPARLETNYKDDTDPAGKVNPANGTSNWGSPPVNEPESLLTGSTYVSVGANDDLVVADPAGWWWQGAGVTEAQHLHLAVQGEYNRFIPGGPGPQNVQLFGHSPITRQGSFSDITYLTRAGGGGVFSCGIANFVALLADPTHIPTAVLPGPTPTVTPILQRAMVNLYGLYGRGPASKTVPSQANWQQYYR